MTRFSLGALAAVLIAGAPTLTFAASCADNTAMSPWGNPTSGGTVSLPYDVAVGDTLTVQASYTRSTAATGNAGLTVIVESFMPPPGSKIINTSSGTVTFDPIVVGAAGGPTIIVTIPDAVGPLSVSVACEPADGGGDPDPTPDESAALDDLQQGFARSVGRTYADSAAAMAGGSIEAAFSDGTEALALGYSGTVVVDATPDDLAAAGYTLWSAARYEAAIPGAVWSGGQVSGAAGVNYRAMDDVVLGVFATAGASSHSDGADDVASRGLGIGALVAYRLDDMWQVQAIANAQQVSYEIASGGVTGAFDATLLSLDASIRGRIPVSAQVDFEPELGVMVLSERQGAYTDSASVAHAAQDFLSGQVTAGGVFKYYPLDSAMVISAGGFAGYGSAGLSGSIEAGIAMELAPSVSLGLDTSLSASSAAIAVRLSGSL